MKTQALQFFVITKSDQLFYYLLPVVDNVARLPGVKVPVAIVNDAIDDGTIKRTGDVLHQGNVLTAYCTGCKSNAVAVQLTQPPEPLYCCLNCGHQYPIVSND